MNEQKSPSLGTMIQQRHMASRRSMNSCDNIETIKSKLGMILRRNCWGDQFSFDDDKLKSSSPRPHRRSDRRSYRRSDWRRRTTGVVFQQAGFLQVVFLVIIAANATGNLPPAVAQVLDSCHTPCADGYSGEEPVPGTGCAYYYSCFAGEVKNFVACGGELLFDAVRGYCNFPREVECVEAPCPPSLQPTGPPPTPKPTRDPTRKPSRGPTLEPTRHPTRRPTKRPSIGPTVDPTADPTTGPTRSPSDRPTASPTGSPSGGPTTSPTLYPTEASKFPSEAPSTGPLATELLLSKRELIESKVLVAYTNEGAAYPSVRYTFAYFLKALQTMAIDGFGADFQFFLGENDEVNYVYGLVNLAAFLANCMVESIQSDSCDETNWQQVAGRHAISNACGQQGRSYQDERCFDERFDIFSCRVDPDMEITAVTSGDEVRAPPPLECQPGSGAGSFSGYWDTSTGTEVIEAPYSNTAGRTDTEGCCWWGRGALLTRGVCNIGKLNYYLGKRAADDGRPSLYPDVDFCAYPEVTCASAFAEELRWTTAFFEWAERIQQYNQTGWAYMDELRSFVDEGLADDSFIETASRILTRGCHEEDCSNLEVRMMEIRKANFFVIITEVFGIAKLLTEKPTRAPSPQPTDTPTRKPTSKPTKEPSSSPTLKPTAGSGGNAPMGPSFPSSPSNPTLPPPTPSLPSPEGPPPVSDPSQPSAVAPSPQVPSPPTPTPPSLPEDSPSDPSTPTNPFPPSPPSSPTTPANPFPPSSPSGPTNPTNPFPPSSPSGPINPTNPFPPSSPSGPINPTNPFPPSSPSGPVNPTNPFPPSPPSGPTNPSNAFPPASPSGPTNPTNPFSPPFPSGPTNPSFPSDPGTPTNPFPSGPTNPFPPTFPSGPTYPFPPTYPSAPVNPVNPSPPTFPSGPSSPNFPSFVPPSPPVQLRPSSTHSPNIQKANPHPSANFPPPSWDTSSTSKPTDESTDTPTYLEEIIFIRSNDAVSARQWIIPMLIVIAAIPCLLFELTV